MFKAIKRRKAILCYREKLGAHLSRRHGARFEYSVEEVRHGVYELELPLDFLSYAYAMFCSREDFDDHHATAKQPCDYMAMRAEIAKITAPKRHDRSSSDGWFDVGGDGYDFGGGDGGGDGGGGGGD